MPPRIYSVEEANSALPEVRDLVGKVVGLVNYLPELHEKVRIAEYERTRPGAARDELQRLQEALEALRSAELEMSKLLTRLESMGVVLKDLRLGLIDFYGYRDGELVELCWRLGEDSVAHWHRVGEGFAGRKPL